MTCAPLSHAVRTCRKVARRTLRKCRTLLAGSCAVAAGLRANEHGESEVPEATPADQPLSIAAVGSDREREKTLALRAELARRIPQVYAAGYSCSRYLRDSGVERVVVYCQEEDYGWAEQICLDLALCVDLRVTAFLSDAPFGIDTQVTRQNLVNSPQFTGADAIDRLDPEDDVIVLCSELDNPTLGRIRARFHNVRHMADLWGDLWWGAFLAQGFADIRRRFPFLPIVLFSQPAYPYDNRDISEIERWMLANNPGNYVHTIFPQLRDGGPLPPTYEEFGYSRDAILEMLDYGRVRMDGNRLRMADFAGRYVNIEEGHRVTPGQPAGASRTVFVFGGCITFGAGCPDWGTSSAYLQKLLVDAGRHDFRVENHGAFIVGRGRFVFETIKSVPFQPGDILISSFFAGPAINGVTWLPDGVFYVDTSHMFDRPHPYGDNVFFDTSHPNEHGQRAIAGKLFDFLESQDFFADFAQGGRVPTDHGQLALPDDERAQLDSYLGSLAPLRRRVGCIVMNCNPFTLGHRYLVEHAASRVDDLFVFVVEEDKSFFPFADRLELVKAGTADLPNVTVVPSGKFIISALTFNDYFGKDQAEKDVVVDPSMDVELFGAEIAPALGITVRFAGEEPLDAVTRQYNDAMGRILPRYGVDFEVIPRVASNGEVISASRVRALLETRDFDAIAKLVPETTLNYLRTRFA